MVKRGCVTPVMLSNVKSKTDDSLDFLDGYEEIPTDMQEKVATAWEQGHVDDADWKGVSSAFIYRVSELSNS